MYSNTGTPLSIPPESLVESPAFDRVVFGTLGPDVPRMTEGKKYLHPPPPPPRDINIDELQEGAFQQPAS